MEYKVVTQVERQTIRLLRPELMEHTPILIVVPPVQEVAQAAEQVQAQAVEQVQVQAVRTNVNVVHCHHH